MASLTMKWIRVLLALTVVAMMNTLCYVSAQQGVSFIITEDIFNQFLKHRNDGACAAKGFYTYNAFVAAANRFPSFGNVGNLDTRKRELAAFFAQTSHETTGGWETAPDGPYAWGYCFKEEQDADPEEMYYGRGPIQLTGKNNYEAAGQALGYDLVNNPEMVASNPIISFKTALWFWMTAQSPKPSSHTVMIGKWSPSGSDTAAGRVPGFGVVTNIINGAAECGRGNDSNQEDRIGFYKSYCDILGASYGSNIDCNTQRSFGG